MLKGLLVAIFALVSAMALTIAYRSGAYAQSATGAQPIAGSDSVSRPTPRHPLAGVASIIEADVISARYTFDETLGPRTEVTLGNIVVHAGTAPTETTFSQLGGPAPNGQYLGVSEQPVLHRGSRYILFLSAGPWFYTPIWSMLAFRIETIGDRSIVLGLQGRPVMSLDSTGVRFGKTPIVDPQAQRDPLKPLPRLAANASSLEVAGALDSKTFGHAALQVAKEVGAPLGRSSLRATSRTPWNVQRTLAPAIPSKER